MVGNYCVWGWRSKGNEWIIVLEYNWNIRLVKGGKWWGYIGICSGKVIKVFGKRYRVFLGYICWKVILFG